MTALELEFSVHYRIMDSESGPWTGYRIRKLCKLLQMTEPEFARYIRVSPGALKNWCYREKFPACIRLLLDIVERSAHETYIGTHHSKTCFPPAELTPNG